MFLPDDLYHMGLTARDDAGRPFNFWAEKKNTTAAGSQIQSIIGPIPQDRALCCQSLTAELIAQTAMFVNYAYIYITPDMVNLVMLKYEVFSGTRQREAITLVEELVLPPNWVIVCNAFYSASGTHINNFHSTGWLIPAGGLR